MEKQAKITLKTEEEVIEYDIKHKSEYGYVFGMGFFDESKENKLTYENLFKEETK